MIFSIYFSLLFHVLFLCLFISPEKLCLYCFLYSFFSFYISSWDIFWYRFFQYSLILFFSSEVNFLYWSRAISSNHCMEIVRIRSFSGPYFPAFGSVRYGVFSPNVGKIRTRKTPNTDTFTQWIFHSYLYNIAYIFVFPSFFSVLVEPAHSLLSISFHYFNLFHANVPHIQKPVNWFALQISWLASICGEKD